VIQVKSMPRRSFLKKGWKLYMGLLGIGIVSGVYPFIGERFWYQVKEVQLHIKNLPRVFAGWRIVQFSDVHFGFHYGPKEFKRVVHIINELNPDILFFTGDFVEVWYNWPELAVPQLRELKAPRGGKWAVLGNHDLMSQKKVIQAFQDSHFQVLQNSNGAIIHNQERIYVAGLEDALDASPNFEKALLGLSAQDCVLLLAHEPDIADISSRYPISAQFSGHSHGGQVRLPFYGPLVTQKMATKYVDGLYYVGESRMPLYVNRGIGTTKVPVRFFCRPEITVFNLSKYIE
jgi:predicted MPP superfamily phosphohydrolase